MSSNPIGDSRLFRQLKKKRREKPSSAVSRAMFNLPDSSGEGRGGAGGGGGASNRSAPIGRLFPGGRKLPLPGIPPRPRPVIAKSKYIPNDGFKAKMRLRGWLDYCTNDKDLKDKKKQKEKEQEQSQGQVPQEQEKPDQKLPDDKDAEEKERAAEKLSEALDKQSHEADQSKREKTFFSADTDGITKQEALNMIEANFGKKVAYHQMILSSGDKDVDPREYAKSQMEALQGILGHEITWIGNVHADTGEDKKHINITIAGKIPDAERNLGKLPYEGKEIDINRVDDQDKFHTSDGNWLTKFHPVHDLKKFAEGLAESKEKLSKEDFKNKLWKWIGIKGYHGDNYFGTPPLKDLDKENQLGGYKPKDIDYDRISDADKFMLGDLPITKYETGAQLKDILNKQAELGVDLGEGPNDKLSKWIGEKEKFGDEVYGSPPRVGEAQEIGKKPKQGLDLDKVPQAEQINICGQTYTKYDSLQSLKNLANQAFKDSEWFMPKDKYEQLKEWIGNKKEFGEDYYGKPPMKELEKGENNALDKSFINKQFKLSDFKDAVDRMAHELTDGKVISPQGAKFKAACEKAAKQIENAMKQVGLKTSWNDRGDVYLDLDSLRLLRAAGNYEVHMRENFDRELERAIEREFHDKDKDRDKDRPLIRGFGNPEKIAKKLKEQFGKVFGGKSQDNKDDKELQPEHKSPADQTDMDKPKEKEQEQDRGGSVPGESGGDATKKGPDDKERDKGDDDFKKRRR